MQKPFKISLTPFLRLFVPVALLLMLGAWFFAEQALDREFAQLREREASGIKLGSGALSNRIDFIHHDLLFLSQHSALRDALEHPGPDTLRHAAEDFSIFSASRGHYDQIRWLDQNGMELVRVDYAQGKPRLIPGDQLQNKGQRYYFTDTIKLAPGEVFVSPLDLNIEHDRIEEPYKPMIRIATPVANRAGAKRGIVILNYYGSDLLQTFSGAIASIADHAMLTNGEGYWLKSPNPADEWGFMFKRPELSLSARHPVAWKAIREQEKGQIELGDGLWTWETVYPLLAGQKTSAGAAEAFVPSSKSLSPKDYVWKPISFLPKEKLDGIRRTVWLKVSLTTGFLLVLFGWGCRLLVRSWQLLDDEKLKFRTVADFAYNWETWRNPQGRLIYCSPSCQRITGHSAEEFIAQPDLLLTITHPEDRILVETHFRQHTAAIPLCELNFRIVLADGQIRRLEHACQAVFSDSGEYLGRRASNRDITERMQAEMALAEANQRMHSLLDSMAEGAYGVDTNGNCRFVNQSFLRILGYDDPGEVIGKHIHELIHHSRPDGSPYPSTECKMYNAYRQNRPVHVSDEVFWSKQGMAIPVEYWSQPILIDGAVHGAIATFIDITERKQALADLRESEERFRQMFERHSAAMLLIEPQSGMIVDANPAAAQFYGYPLPALRGMALSRINTLPEEEIAQQRQLAIAQQQNYFVFEHRLCNGELRTVEVYSSPVSFKNTPLLFSIVHDITERKRIEAQIRNLAFLDALTQLPNRRLLSDRLDQAIASCKRNSHCAALMFLDLDNFKPLNDTYGHEVGDLLLIEAARRIAASVRETDTVARFGGDEFVVMLGELDANPHEAARQAGHIAEKIRIALAEPYLLNSDSTQIEHHCTSSIGVAVFNHPAIREEIMKWADLAMYQAKHGGRNQVVVNQHANQPQATVLNLNWQPAYECGDPVIDQQHRRLFELANLLIEAAFKRDEQPSRFAHTLDELIEHIAHHFADEERILAAHGYHELDTHAHLHRQLLAHARKLQDMAASDISIGELVDFLINEIVVQHMLGVDRQFYPLFGTHKE